MIDITTGGAIIADIGESGAEIIDIFTLPFSSYTLEQFLLLGIFCLLGAIVFFRIWGVK